MGALAFAADAYELRQGATAEGTVTHREEDEFDLTLRLRFEVEGRAQECETTDVQGQPVVGDVVAVRYVPGDPDGLCAVGDAAQSYAPAAGFAAATAATSAWAVRSARARRRWRRRLTGDRAVDTW